MMANSTVSTLGSLIELLREHWQDTALGYYYRGEPRLEDSLGPRRLLPALLRADTFDTLAKVHDTQDPIAIQAKLLHLLQRYVPPGSWPESTFFRGDLPFGDLVTLAQHHGLPTLLLDWTRNPLAAIYFAVAKHDHVDGRFWYMELKRGSQRSHCTCHLEEGEKLDERVDTPVLVVPRPFSRRIEVQLGRFIYFGSYRQSLEEISDFTMMPFNSVRAVRVPSVYKKQLRKELRHFQVHGGTMFPSLEGYAEYLAHGGL